MSLSINGKEFSGNVKEKWTTIFKDKYEVGEAFEDADGNPNIDDYKKVKNVLYKKKPTKYVKMIW